MTYIAEIKDIPYDKKRADVVLSDGEICRAFKATIKEYGLVERKNIDFADLTHRKGRRGTHRFHDGNRQSVARDKIAERSTEKSEKQKVFGRRRKRYRRKIAELQLSRRPRLRRSVRFVQGAKTGRRKIIYELITIKGIDKNVAQEVAYAKLSDEEEIEKAISMAQKYIEKEKKKRTRLKERAYCFLATRGFDTDIISSAMNSLDFSEEE